MLHSLRRKMAQWLLPKESLRDDLLPRHARERYTVLAGPDFDKDLAAYVLNEWVNTAIDRVSELSASTPLQVKDRQGKHIDHPLLWLVGPLGRPNQMQDAIEFLETHFTRMDVHGNDIWYWLSRTGGAPDEVYQLDPRRIQIRVTEGIPTYFYTASDGQFLLDRRQITHFKRGNIIAPNPYWGISALHKLQAVISSDSNMSEWNKQFFESGVPSGILFVERDMATDEMKKLQKDLVAFHKSDRKVAVLRATPSVAQFVQANLAHREMEFTDGRMLTRQAAFDALGFHAGLVSESSTEAHARIAERQVRQSAHNRQRRLASQLNDALRFWPGWENYRLQFGDVRLTDWEQEERKIKGLTLALQSPELKALYQNELGLT